MVEKRDIFEFPISICLFGFLSVSFIASLLLTSILYVLYIPFYLIRTFFGGKL